MQGSWKVSLRLQIRDRWIFVAGPREALGVIEETWPCSPGPLWAAARRQCYRSLQKDGEADRSRMPFIAAAIEAQIVFV